MRAHIRPPHPSWPREVPPGSVILGTTSRGKKIWLPPELRKLGLHIVGLPNQGKSKLMEGMAWQDMVGLCGLDRTVIFADPHGTSAAALFNKGVTYGIDRIRPIRYLDISDPDYIFKLNPLRRRPGIDPAVPAAAAVDAVLKGSWGHSGQDPDAQPQLQETLSIAFATTVEFGGSFADAAALLELDDSTGLRAFAAEQSENPLVRSFWRTVGAHRPREREALLGSARRRMVRFMLPRRTREIFSDPDNGIDWRRVMDEGEVVLLSLAFDEAGVVSEQQATTVGTLILHDLFLACRGRGPEDMTAFLYWDEVHRYLSEAAARFFTEARKFKVHPIFAHQIFQQLDEVSPFVKGAMMAIPNKIFFAGLPPDDAEFAARFAFRGHFDLEKAKHAFDKPVTVDHVPEWLLAESESRGRSAAEGTNWSGGGAIARSRSTTRSFGTAVTAGTTVGKSAGWSEQRQRSRSASRSTSEATASSQSTSWQRSESAGGSSSQGAGTSTSTAARYRRDEADTIGGPTLIEGRSTQSSSGSSWARGSAWGGAAGATTTRTRGRGEQIGEASTAGRSGATTLAQSRSVAHSSSIALSDGLTETANWSQGGSTTISASEATTTGRSQTLRAVLEVMPTQGFTLEELIHMAAARIAYLNQGECVVKIGKRHAAKIKTLRVKDGWASPQHIARAKARIAAAVSYLIAVQQEPAALAAPDEQPAQAQAQALGNADPVPAMKEEEWG